jgi:hypothetical protein
MKASKIFPFYLGLILIVLNVSQSAFAQKIPDGEVLLNFNYPAVGNVYLTGVFFGEVAYLPLGEVLSLLYIPAEKIASGKGLQGKFPGENDDWAIDPITNQLTIKGKSGNLDADKYYIRIIFMRYLGSLSRSTPTR